jgi:hypothetical protein
MFYTRAYLKGEGGKRQVKNKRRPCDRLIMFFGSTIYVEKYRNLGCERAYARSHPKFRDPILLKAEEPYFQPKREVRSFRRVMPAQNSSHPNSL